MHVIHGLGGAVAGIYARADDHDAQLLLGASWCT